MAKKKGSMVIRLMSMAGTGFFYTMRKAVRANAEKCAVLAPHTALHTRSPTAARPRARRLQLIKFDPRVNARVLFKEERIKKSKK